MGLGISISSDSNGLAMKIIVERRNVYGNEMIYPKCETAKLLAELARHTTLTKTDIYTIKQLGYEVVIQAHEYSL